jgi:hypothetical protein
VFILGLSWSQTINMYSYNDMYISIYGDWYIFTKKNIKTEEELTYITVYVNAWK